MATVPSPRTWSTGDLFTAGIGNSLRDTLNFLLSPPRAELYIMGNAFSCPSGAKTVVSWPSVVMDTDGMTAASSSYLKINTPGSYRVSAQIAWKASAGGTGLRVLNIVKNGTFYIAQTFGAPNTTASNVDAFPSLEITGLVAGDQISVVVYQDTGGTLTTISDSNVIASWLRAEWCGF